MRETTERAARARKWQSTHRAPKVTPADGHRRIPLVDLKAQYQSIRAEIDPVMESIVSSGDFILGKEVERFEQEFSAYCGAAWGIGVSSGTEALHLALLAAGVGKGDEVITTPFTFIATAEAISQVGATPVFVDITRETFNINPWEIERAITDRTKAILPVHLYGRPADMDAIIAIARRRGVKVIEDAAQAHGAMYKDRCVGSVGDVGCFSFYPGKNLGAFGDAGMIVTSDREIAERAYLLRDHGRYKKYEHLTVGFNSRLDNLQAGVLRVKLRHLDAWNKTRRAIARAYADALRPTGIGLPPGDRSTRSVYHLFVIRSPERTRIQHLLDAEGVATGIHYPVPLHLQPAYRYLHYAPGDFPESERAANEVLSLPLYPEMTGDQVQRVLTAVQTAQTATTAVA